MRGCRGEGEVKRRMVSDMFVKRKFDALALSETKMKGNGECDFDLVR